MIRLGSVLLLAFAGCGGDERTERELFLKRIHDYAAAPDDGKGPALEALRRLRPTTPAVREAHGICLAAYGGIERAEAEHARAERLLADVEASRRSLDATQEEIRRAIEASNAAVQTAREAIDRCTKLVDGLRLGRE